MNAEEFFRILIEHQFKMLVDLKAVPASEVAKSFASITTTIDTDTVEYWFRYESAPGKARVWTHHHAIRPHKRT